MAAFIVSIFVLLAIFTTYAYDGEDKFLDLCNDTGYPFIYQIFKKDSDKADITDILNKNAKRNVKVTKFYPSGTVNFTGGVTGNSANSKIVVGTYAIKNRYLVLTLSKDKKKFDFSLDKYCYASYK